MKYLYKYPHAAFPYAELVAINKGRNRGDLEYELLDTGVFHEDRYFDIFVEYAKQAVDDILIQVSIHNRGPERATLHLLPTLWFRNTWSWWPEAAKPSLVKLSGAKVNRVVASHPDLGNYCLYCDKAATLLFTDNETNNERLFGTANTNFYLKDGVNNYLVEGRQDAVNPTQQGTKVAVHHQTEIASSETAIFRLRLTSAPASLSDPFVGFDQVMHTRQKESDEFYRAITPGQISEDRALVMRQALSGMLWSKQYFCFDVNKWLVEHGADPMGSGAPQTRNRDWFHMVNQHIFSMPDKWEYPWYAAWDLAFHTLALSAVDVDFAKEQLELLLQEFFLHPTGQLPACEWNFSDVNPPVHAWAAIFLYRTEQALGRGGDIEFLKRCFSKLLLNFSWWVNRKDRVGKNLFEGGFLGLDNIGVFDRSAPLPGGGFLEQADGTAWMGLFCQNMLEIGVELAAHEPGYFEEMATKFGDHFLWIARAMNHAGPGGMWDEADGFYYDVLRMPDGGATRLKVRSMVGLLPLCATTIIEPWQRERAPCVTAILRERLQRMPELRDGIHPTGPGNLGVGGRGIAALVNPHRLRRILSRMLDENEFLSPYGIRALSRYHAENPYVFNIQNQSYRVCYLPAESDSGMFGGNSNWRGPIWMPVNVLLIRALLSFFLYYGDNFKVECPTGSGKLMNLFEVAREIGDRLTRIFLRDESGRRPVYGGTSKFQTDPHWKDYVLFYEYFHGDNGAGIGASHQTGWSGLVAKLIQLFGQLDGEQFLRAGKTGVFGKREQGSDSHARAA